MDSIWSRTPDSSLDVLEPVVAFVACRVAGDSETVVVDITALVIVAVCVGVDVDVVIGLDV